MKSPSVGVDRDLLVPLDRGLAFAHSPGLSGLPPGDWSWTQHTHAYRVHQALSSREFLHKRPHSLIKPSCGQIWPPWIALESAVNKSHTWHLSPGNINNFLIVTQVRFMDMHAKRLRAGLGRGAG